MISSETTSQCLFRMALAVIYLAAFCYNSASYATGGRGGPNAAWVGKNFHGQKCQGFHGTVGTYDYLKRNEFLGLLANMHEHHFSPGVENLTQGLSSSPMGDIDFILRTVPNHHRAMASAIKFRNRNPVWPPSTKGMPAECYLQRAIKFSPNDVTMHYQYAMLQQNFKQHAGAAKSYQEVERLSPGDPIVQYNLALALVEIKQYKQARKIAENLYAQKFPLPGLKRKLIAAGYWKPEPKKKAKPTQAQIEAYARAMEKRAVKESANGTPGSDPAPLKTGETAAKTDEEDISSSSPTVVEDNTVTTSGRIEPIDPQPEPVALDEELTDSTISQQGVNPSIAQQ